MNFQWNRRRIQCINCVLSGFCLHSLDVPILLLQGFPGRDGIPGSNGLPGPPGHVFVIPVRMFPHFPNISFEKQKTDLKFKRMPQSGRRTCRTFLRLVFCSWMQEVDWEEEEVTKDQTTKEKLCVRCSVNTWFVLLLNNKIYCVFFQNGFHIFSSIFQPSAFLIFAKKHAL